MHVHLSRAYSNVIALCCLFEKQVITHQSHVTNLLIIVACHCSPFGPTNYPEGLRIIKWSLLFCAILCIGNRMSTLRCIIIVWDISLQILLTSYFFSKNEVKPIFVLLKQTFSKFKLQYANPQEQKKVWFSCTWSKKHFCIT